MHLSADPLAKYFPFGLNATEKTGPLNSKWKIIYLVKRQKQSTKTIQTLNDLKERYTINLFSLLSSHIPIQIGIYVSIVQLSTSKQTP